MTNRVFLGNVELVKENVQKHNFYNNFENFDGCETTLIVEHKGERKKGKKLGPPGPKKKKRNFLMIIYIYIYIVISRIVSHSF